MLRRFTALFILLLFLTPIAATAAEQLQTKQLKGRVVNIVAEENLDGAENNLPNKRQVLEVEILGEPFKGEKHELTNNYSTTNPLMGTRIDNGEQVLLYIEIDNQGKVKNLYIQEPIREIPIYILIVLFALAHVIVGGLKGLKALLTLALTGVLIFFVLMPLILRGYNPIPITVMICFAVTLVSVIILNGWSFKSWSTIIGTGGGVMLAAAMAYVFGSWSKIIGLDMEEVSYLLNVSQSVSIDFHGILFSAMILGSLGAVLAVTISIASSVEEIYYANPGQTRRELFHAGMNVGKDLMATMSNTLVLAYVGTAIPLILLYAAKQLPYMQTINDDLIASEVIRSVAGSIGLISAIPLTAFLTSAMLGARLDTDSDKPENLSESVEPYYER